MGAYGGMGAKAIIKNKRYHKIEEIRVSVLQCLLPASVPEGPKARRPEGRTNEGFHCFLYYYIFICINYLFRLRYTRR